MNGMSSAGEQYPETLTIEPLTRPPKVMVRVPGSKSITNRALALAALANGETRRQLHNLLFSEDTAMMMLALDHLGFGLELDVGGMMLRPSRIRRIAGGRGFPNWFAEAGIRETDVTAFIYRASSEQIIPAPNADLFVGNSGTTMRFLTAMLALGHGRYRLDGVPRMRERPIEDLLSALRAAGVNAYSEAGNGCPPVIVEANGLKGGSISIKGDVSSQFLSALLMAAPFAEGPLEIELTGPLVSEPYVRMTVEMVRQWGLHIETRSPSLYYVPAPQMPPALVGPYEIEPDASAASYFFAAAAVTGGEVTVSDFWPTKRLQGDLRFVELLRMMGCKCRYHDEGIGIIVQGGALQGIDVDMNDISDTVMTLAAVACFAEGPTTIHNVAHVRHKETDRLAALAAELRRVGAEVDEFVDGLTITPRPLHGAEIETYNDHRMAMSMALLGLRVPGIVIKDPGCVAKTYPGFFRDLEKLR
jgi:3-phosphoshikimate 1-carboxyvinyltransferase